MKNTKKIIAVIMMTTIICGIFVACSRGNERDQENAVDNTAQVSVQTNTQDIADKDKEISTNEVTDAVTVNAAKSDEQNNEDQTVTDKKQNTTATTNKKETTTAKKVEITTAKKVVTTTKKKAETTTKKKVTTTKKAVTTTKKAVKNVTVAEVQSQLNSYLKSKGFTIDTSLRPNNSSWRTQISCMQENLNNGYTLGHGKDAADLAYKECINSGYKAKEVAAYCYYGNSVEGNAKKIYILYLPGGGICD